MQQSFRAIREPWFSRLFVVLGCGAAVLVAANIGVTPLEATVQMERLAAKVERAVILPRETKDAIARLIGQPAYDCDLVACRPELARRNRAVRVRLEGLLSNGMRNEASAARGE